MAACVPLIAPDHATMVPSSVAKMNVARPLLPPTELFLPADAFNGAIKTFGRVELGGNAAGPTNALPPVQVDRRADDPLTALKRFIATTELRVAIVAESAGRRETMQHYFAEYGLLPALGDTFDALVDLSEHRLVEPDLFLAGAHDTSFSTTT